MSITLNISQAGTIGTYADLVEKIALWMDRDDLGPRIPDFVALCEARINRHLRPLNLETEDIWTVSTETFQLPSDFRMLRTIYIEGQPDRPLRGMSPNALPSMFSGEPGIPTAYALRADKLVLAPPPLAPFPAVDLQVVYFRKLPPLTENDQVNWLLEQHSDCYMAGCLLEAAAFIRDDAAVSYYTDRFETFIEEIKIAYRRDRWGAGPIVPNTVVQVRGGRC